jgi:hypothetical protein
VSTVIVHDLKTTDTEVGQGGLSTLSLEFENMTATTALDIKQSLQLTDP